MKKVLVIGGAGFIGSFTVDALVKRGYQVRVLDNLDPQVHPRREVPPYLNRDVEFIKGDVRSRQELRKALRGMEAVFHLAAAVGVGQSQYQIRHYVDVNVGGTANLLDIIVNTKNKVEKIVIAASMSSYGEGCYQCSKCGQVRPPLRTEEQLNKGVWELYCPYCQGYLRPIPTTEQAERFCNSIYALTKRDQEDMVLNIGQTYKIPVTALRYFNVYGPRQSLSNPYTGVTAIFMSRIKNDNPPIIYEDGLQTRDFISVHDVVRANLLALESGDHNYQVFNVGSGIPRTIREVAELLAVLYQKDIAPLVTNKFRKGDVRHCYADISKIKSSLGFEPQVNFADGMKELIAWAYEAEAEDRFDQAVQELTQKGLI
jgi:dTDP-L-rhamnose 4-epimerase